MQSYLIEFLRLSNVVYILRLQNDSWYIGSVMDYTLFNRYQRHECFKQNNFQSVYIVINVYKHVLIDSFIVERILQNYASNLLKMPKSKIYKCGSNGFVCSEKQMQTIIMRLLLDPYFNSVVTVNRNKLGLKEFNKKYFQVKQFFSAKDFIHVNKIMTK